MSKQKTNSKTLIIFIVTLSIIGLLSGYFYYSIQPNSIKINIKNSYNIKEDLKLTTNNIPNTLKSNTKRIIYTITIIPNIISISNIFYLPFQTGFILNYLSSYGIKFSIIYITIYNLIPLAFTLTLIKLSLRISHNIIRFLIYKDSKIKNKIIILFKKYFLIFITNIIYDIIIYLISSDINAYLVTILNI